VSVYKFEVFDEHGEVQSKSVEFESDSETFMFVSSLLQVFDDMGDTDWILVEKVVN